jgi:hypothetical protein
MWLGENSHASQRARVSEASTATIIRGHSDGSHSLPDKAETNHADKKHMHPVTGMSSAE